MKLIRHSTLKNLHRRIRFLEYENDKLYLKLNHEALIENGIQTFKTEILKELKLKYKNYDFHFESSKGMIILELGVFNVPKSKVRKLEHELYKTLESRFEKHGLYLLIL